MLPSGEPSSRGSQVGRGAASGSNAAASNGPSDAAVSDVASLAAAAPSASSGSPYFIAPSAVDARTIGQLLLRHGQSNDEPLGVIAAVRILAGTVRNPAEPQIRLWKKHLDRAEKAAADNVIVGLLAAEAHWQLNAKRRTPHHDGRWTVGLHRFTQVGLGELACDFGESTGDHLAYLVGILLLAKAEHQAGIPPTAELNERVETFLNRAGEPIWVRLADYVVDVLDQRAIRALQQRPGEDWPRFLGPKANGRIQETQLIRQWPANGPPLVWELDAGKGFGACSIHAGLLFLFDRVGDYNRLLCVDQETGAVLGKTFAYPAADAVPGGYRGPRASPVIDGDRVYLLDEAGLLYCVRAGTSDVVWRADTTREFGVEANQFGVAATPMIVDNLLILVVGGGETTQKQSRTRTTKPNGSALVAFEKETGKVVYASGNYLADYASPVLATIDGVPWGLAYVREGLVGFAPHSGRIVTDFPWRATDLTTVNAASPVVFGNEVFISNAHGQGSALLEINPDGFQPVWTDDPDAAEKRFEAYFGTPVYHGGHLYGCSGKDSHSSDLRCIEWKSGELKWKEEGLNRVSLIEANGQLICLTEYGELLLIDAVPDNFRLVSSVKLPRTSNERQSPEFRVPGLLEYPCWAAPVLSRGYLYLRSPNKLVCLDLLAPEHETPRDSPAVPMVETAEDTISDDPKVGDAPVDPHPATEANVEPDIADDPVVTSDKSDEEVIALPADASQQEPPSNADVQATSAEQLDDSDEGVEPKHGEDRAAPVNAAAEVLTVTEAPERDEPQPSPPLPENEDKIGGDRKSDGGQDSDTAPSRAEVEERPDKSVVAVSGGSQSGVDRKTPLSEVDDQSPTDDGPRSETDAQVLSKSPESTPSAAPSDEVKLDSPPLIGNRVWHNARGKRLHAAIISFNGETVVFRLPNGREHPYPFARLSDADQLLIISASRKSNDQLSPSAKIQPSKTQASPPLRSESGNAGHPAISSSDNAASPPAAAMALDSQPFLGIHLRNAKSNRVDRVYSGTVAERLGILVGDRLISINGQQIDDLAQMQSFLKTLAVGELVRIEVFRDGVVYELGPSVIGGRRE